MFTCPLVYLPMPDLFDSLLKQDIGHLRIIAEFWGLELDSKSADAAREKLSISLLDPNLLAELTDTLPPEADSAITYSHQLLAGEFPGPLSHANIGDIREAGAGKRDREKLYLKPASAAEILYYRGLLARAFFDTEKGPQEFAYIPDDLLDLLNREEIPCRGTKENRKRYLCVSMTCHRTQVQVEEFWRSRERGAGQACLSSRKGTGDSRQRFHLG